MGSGSLLLSSPDFRQIGFATRRRKQVPFLKKGDFLCYKNKAGLEACQTRRKPETSWMETEMLEQIGKVPLFATLSDEELGRLADLATRKALGKNAVVVREGDNTDSLYIVLSGKVKIYLNDKQGREVVLGMAGGGEYFGEMVLDGGPRSASVMTLEPSEFAVLRKADLESYLRNNPQVALAIIRELIGRVRSLTDNVRSLALLDVYGRFRKLLLDLAEEVNGHKTIREPLTQQEIANRIGASREMISRILRELNIGGYISIDRKRITLLRDLPTGW
jgi:CRP/FNR family cyclic AMP-dependent transcriptional regulator